MKLLKQQLAKHSNKEKAKLLQGFFKTGYGEYGQGDIFLGITVPQQRKIAKEASKIKIKEVKKGRNCLCRTCRSC